MNKFGDEEGWRSGEIFYRSNRHSPPTSIQHNTPPVPTYKHHHLTFITALTPSIPLTTHSYGIIVY